MSRSVRTVAAIPAMVIATGVNDDAAQPSGEFRFAFETVDLLDQGAAHVLRDIVGVRGRTGHAPGNAVDAVIVAAEQRFEGGTIA